MKTIKQIAEEIGVDKQKVYRFIKKNHIKEVHQNCINEALQKTGAKYYDEAAETLIKQGFCCDTASNEAHHEAHQNCINEAVFEALLKHLDTLENELKVKNEQIERLGRLLDQQQQLNAVAEQKLLQATSSSEEYEKTWFGLYKKRG